jgi:chemotaxis protein histidine kinase CheA
MRDEPEIIRHPNTLRNKVSFGADGVDPAVLARADAAVASLKADYIAWAEDDLGGLQASFDKALTLPIEDRSPAMQAVFASAHDMKGQGGSFDYPLITDIAGRLCQFLERTACFDEAAMDSVRLHIDAMRVVLARRMSGEGGAEAVALLGRLPAD